MRVHSAMQRCTSPSPPKAGAGAPSDTRHVGAFTVQPDVARRLLASRIESAERRRAEELVTATTGYRYVRFVQLRLTWLGPAGGDGPRLSPVYVPAYVYSWIHGGIKIQTFVSGVDGRASGPHHLDDTKVAVLATIATSGALLLSGAAASMTATQLFGGWGRGREAQVAQCRCAVMLMPPAWELVPTAYPSNPFWFVVLASRPLPASS